MKTPVLYNNDFQAYQTNQQQVVSNCAEITFINYGETVCTLNGTLPIPPNGGSISFDGKQYEYDNTFYSFSFDNSNPALANGLCIIRKNYAEYPKTTE